MSYFDLYRRRTRTHFGPPRSGEHRGVEIDDRIEAVYKAIQRAAAFTPAAIYDATGQDFQEIARAVIPSLLGFTAVLVVTTAGGMMAGAALGSLLFGTGLAPGAYVGATVGLQAGVVILNYLGLAFLAVHIGQSFWHASFMAQCAIREAWSAPDHPAWEDMNISHASRTLTEAIARVFTGILEGIVAFLLAKGTASAAQRVPELTTKLRSSRLGAGFAAWVEKNWQSLIKNPRLRGEPAGPIQDGGAPFPKDLEPIPFPKREGQTSGRASKDYEGTLRNQKVTLNRIQEKEIVYMKRDRAEYVKLQREFNGGVRKNFLKDLGADPQKVQRLREAGLSEHEINIVKNGGVPKGWNVHHKLPLDDGGGNNPENLILIKNDPAHFAITNAQGELTKNLEVGETSIIKFPTPEGFVYP